VVVAEDTAENKEAVMLLLLLLLTLTAIGNNTAQLVVPERDAIDVKF
jgi:hypothetical protein